MADGRFLITGASGFIGQALAEELVKTLPSSSELFSMSLNPYSKTRFQHFVCDLNQPKEVERAIHQISPDHIFHLSGLSQVSQEIPFKSYFVANTLQTLNLLNALSGQKKRVTFLLASSIHVYGNQSGTVSEETPLKPQGAYAFSKYLAEEAVKKHSRAHPNFQGIITRLSSCLGPGQPTGFVTADFIEKLRLTQKSKEPKITTGPLTGTRQFMDQRDVARALVLLIQSSHPTSTEIFNLASPQQTSVRELLEVLLELIQSSIAVEPQNDSLNSFKGLQISTDKFSSSFPSFTWRPLRESLRDMLKS